MKIAPCPGPLFEKVTLGVYFNKSFKVVTLSLLSVSVLKAWMVSGTSWIDSSRRVAVTTMSPIAVREVSSAAGAGADCALAGAAIPTDSAIATAAVDAFQKVFIGNSPSHPHFGACLSKNPKSQTYPMPGTVPSKAERQLRSFARSIIKFYVNLDSNAAAANLADVIPNGNRGI
jgi:hypothetical protein